MTSLSVRRSIRRVRNRGANDFMDTAVRKSTGRRVVRAIITTRQHHKSFGGSCPYRQTANNPPSGSAKRPGTCQRPPCPARCCRFGDRSRTIARNSLTARDARCHSKHALRLPYSRGFRHRCCARAAGSARNRESRHLRETYHGMGMPDAGFTTLRHRRGAP